MLWDIIIFMRENPKLGPFEGVGNENLDFLRGPRLFGPLLNGPLPKSRLLEGAETFLAP